MNQAEIMIRNIRQDACNEITNAIEMHGDNDWQLIYEEMYEQLYMDQGGEYISGFINVIDETYANFKKSYWAEQRILENAK